MNNKSDTMLKYLFVVEYKDGSTYQQNENVWVIHVLFIIATLLDIGIGYWLGTILTRNFAVHSSIPNKLSCPAE